MEAGPFSSRAREAKIFRPHARSSGRTFAIWGNVSVLRSKYSNIIMEVYQIMSAVMKETLINALSCVFNKSNSIKVLN